jgi:flagellar basal-body rod modification protein FlgD
MQVNSPSTHADSVGLTGGSSISTSSSQSSSGSSEFMLMMMAQLRNQNPLDPMQDKDMMGQIAQLNSLEELKSIRTMMEASYHSSQSAYGMEMIGKDVKALLDSGETVTGTVTGASWISNTMYLQIGERNVPLESIYEVNGGKS